MSAPRRSPWDANQIVCPPEFVEKKFVEKGRNGSRILPFQPRRKHAFHRVPIGAQKRSQLFYAAIEGDEIALIRFRQME